MQWREIPYKQRRAIKAQLLARDNWLCCICGLKIKRFSDATVEHKLAQNSGGSHSMANLGPAHGHCNYSRQDRALVGRALDGRSFF